MLACERRFGGTVMDVQLVTHTAGRPSLAAGRLGSDIVLALAAPSALGRLSVPTTPLLSMILLWQHSGATRTQTSHKSAGTQTAWVSCIPSCVIKACRTSPTSQCSVACLMLLKTALCEALRIGTVLLLYGFQRCALQLCNGCRS